MALAPAPTIATLPKPPTSVAPAPTMDAFDAFGSVSAGGTNTMFPAGNVMMSGVPSQQQAMMMMMMMQQQQTGVGATGGSMRNLTSAANDGDDDDFGGFSGADSSAKISIPNNDPTAKLVSLDGLSKNKKKEDPLARAIVFNEAAAVQVQQKHSSDEAESRAKSLNRDLSFRGIDGLSGSASPAALASKNQVHRKLGQPVMQSSSDEKANLIAMMGDHSFVGGNASTTIPAGMFQQPGAQQMQMTPQMMQQMLMMQQRQAMMGGTAAQAGMAMNPQMMQQMGQMNGNGGAMPMGGMTPQMMMMMQSNPQMFGMASSAGQMNWMQGMGGMGTGGAANHMGMGAGGSTMGGQSSSSGNKMGGQPMQGWH